MRWILFFCFLTSLVSAGDLTAERLWTGVNGKSFRGIFVRLIDDGAKVEIANSSGQIFAIDIENLCKPDRVFITQAMEAGKAKADAKDQGDASMFKTMPPINREGLVRIPVKEDGVEWTNLATCSVGSVLYWWHNADWFEIPRRGDAYKKALWLDDELKRQVNPRNSTVPLANDVMKGMARYLDKNLSDVMTYRFHVVNELNPANFVKYTRAGDACLIYAHADPGNYGVWMTLIDAKENGEVKLGCFNRIITAQWEQTEDKDSYFASNETYEIPVPEGGTRRWMPCAGARTRDPRICRLKVRNPEDMASWLRDPGMVFTLRPSMPMVICRPYAFVTKGAKAAPPRDPIFDPEDAKPAVPVRQKVIDPGEPFEFTTAFTKDCVWKFSDGSSFKGNLDIDDRQKPVLRNLRGGKRDLDPDFLTPEDQARYYFARGCTGHAAAPPRLELRYQLRTEHGGTFDFTISTMGSLARVRCNQTDRTLIFDLEDRSYHCFIGSTFPYYGRWRGMEEGGQPGLLPEVRRFRDDGGKAWEAFKKSVAEARPSLEFPFPARSASFDGDSENFIKPGVDFTLLRHPAATVAIYQILNAESPASANPANPKDPTRRQFIVFSHGVEVSNHHGFTGLAERLVAHNMLPLRLRWTNSPASSWVREADRIKASGKFDFQLVGASVPAEFPKDFFAIPPAAREAEIGTCIVQP